MTQKQKYNHAGERLVDWVEDCEKQKLDSSLAATLLLDQAVDLWFYLFGPDKAREAVDKMMREKIVEYGGADPENN